MSFVGMSCGYIGNATTGLDATLGIVSENLPRLTDGNDNEDDAMLLKVGIV